MIFVFLVLYRGKHQTKAYQDMVSHWTIIKEIFVSIFKWRIFIRLGHFYIFSLDSGGAQYESIEALLDLEVSSPYTVDYNWSKEAGNLRKIAIETPESLQDPSFILKHFTTLRIVDKNVILNQTFC
jgi:hypothetical protein